MLIKNPTNDVIPLKMLKDKDKTGSYTSLNPNQVPTKL